MFLLAVIKNSLRFSANEASTRKMFAQERAAREMYYGKMEAKMCCCEASLAEEEDFFDAVRDNDDTTESGTDQQPVKKITFFDRLFGSK